MDVNKKKRAAHTAHTLERNREKAYLEGGSGFNIRSGQIRDEDEP